MKTKAKPLNHFFTKNDRKFSLLRGPDKLTIGLFISLFAASVVAFFFLVTQYDFTVYTALPVMATPFFLIGVIFYIINRRYIAGLFIIALSVIGYFLAPVSVLFIVYLLVCSEGVVVMVEMMQRMTFYSIMDIISNVNTKKHLSIKDRVVVFFFNIPVDLDTRSLTIDSNISRTKLPWRDMMYTIMLALTFCMFLWIYVFLNPTFSLGTSGVPIYTFTIILYLCAMVMPWTIFSTVNARISTDYRDFKLYTGLLETFKRMFLPIFAAILFLIIALSSGPDNYFYIGMSLAMIVVMIVFTSIMYFTSNEVSLVNDIMDRWSDFHPVDLYSGFESEHERTTLDDDVPGTPRRNPKDCFVPDIRTRR